MNKLLKILHSSFIGFRWKIINRLKKTNTRPRTIIIITGIISTVWFIIRLIQKPSCAAHPCMKVAAPVMPGFILYLMSIWGVVLASVRTRSKFINVRFIATFLLITGVVTVMAVTPAGQNKKTSASETAVIEQKKSDGQGSDQTYGVNSKSFNSGFTAKNFSSVVVDDKNVKWFLTDAGIASYNGKKWQLHNKNKKVPSKDLGDMAFDISSYGKELWLASPLGATVVTLPVNTRSGVTTYYKGNSKILSDTVVAVAVGKGALRWFGTNRGVSAFLNNKWLDYSYQKQYPESLFQDFPITAMATTTGGDSLYVATKGAGVARVFKDKVDAISGASEYAIWGPIEMPSDNVYSICITPDGTQWFGTDLGIARHIGDQTLENWTIFTTDDGLVDNFVQCITYDNEGSIWFGTKGGISVLKGEEWRSITTENGLMSNNIQCITIDKQGIIWCGTNTGVISINNGLITNFK